MAVDDHRDPGDETDELPENLTTCEACGLPLNPPVSIDQALEHFGELDVAAYVHEGCDS